jgi:ABC-type glycerol-3-phosphate transport system substrate-binding protein
MLDTFDLFLSRRTTDARRSAAWELATWLSQPEQQAGLAVATGMFPATLEAASAEPLASRWARSPVLAQTWAALSGPASLANPLIGPLFDIENTIYSAIAAALDGTDVGPALTTAVDTANDVLSDYRSAPVHFRRCLHGGGLPVPPTGC